MTDRSPSRWRALLELLRPDRTRWLALGALVAATSALGLAGPIVLRRIIDQATAGATTQTIVGLAVVFLVIAIVTQLAQVAVAWSATVAAWRTTNDLRLSMTRHVLTLDHEFHRTHTPGELIQRVDGDVTSVSDFLGKVVPRALGAIFLVVGMNVVLAVIDWRLALGMIAYLGLAGGMLAANRHRAISESASEMGDYARLYGGIEERLTATEDLRANGATAYAIDRFVTESSAALASSVARERAFMSMWWAVQGALAVGVALSLIAGAALVGSGTITIGTAFLLFQYVLAVSRPLEDVVHQLETMQKANGAMHRVAALRAIRPTVIDAGTTSPPAGPLGVSVMGVSFDYGDDQPVLRSIDAEIAPGRSVGIVGRTGSGKTTFSRLVLRLTDATEGTVLLGGVPIGDIPMSELRRRVALIPQEVELFSGSIRDNVTLFDDAPTDDEVRDALANVGLGALADGGIDRQLGAGGEGLSAGESQLLALARVWLRQPDLIVLDEATARVDPETEEQIDAAVARLIEGRTTLVIAHRLSTLQTLDEIMVFDRGEIVEHGERGSLVADGDSRFAQLLELALEVSS
ncbi:MAG: ABC transporter ATP-binding protein [Acidimicrobiales bacterium]